MLAQPFFMRKAQTFPSPGFLIGFRRMEQRENWWVEHV